METQELTKTIKKLKLTSLVEIVHGRTMTHEPLGALKVKGTFMACIVDHIGESHHFNNRKSTSRTTTPPPPSQWLDEVM